MAAKAWAEKLIKPKWARRIRQALHSNKPVLSLPSPADSSDIDLPKQEQSHACPNYMTLKHRFRDIGRMNGIMEALGRDFLTAMPEGAYKSRLGQIAFLARHTPEVLANQDITAFIERAQSHARKHKKLWDEWDVANLREMESMYRHQCKVSPDLTEKLAKLSYEGRRHHREVLKNNDWDLSLIHI